jgi:hypothetical protein
MSCRHAVMVHIYDVRCVVYACSPTPDVLAGLRCANPALPHPTPAGRELEPSNFSSRVSTCRMLRPPCPEDPEAAASE